ncbi:MAG: YfcE family phosphodiesterase [Eubacteriales bacterium]|nr:YfcE family phosphodiesterase [Eubacteriales bacterium]
MIRAAVFADTHTNTARMLEAVRTLRPDVLIHLGDHDRDAEALRRTFPELPLHVVRGNCDILGNTPERLVVELGPVKAFCTHGHLYSVDWSFDYLVYAAQEAGAKLALCGHTHEAANLEIGGVQVLNPGTAGKGRTLSCGLVTVFDNGGIACEIRPL